MGVFQVLQDWQLVKKQKAGLLDALRQTPPGAGVSMSNASDPIVARAVIELLREYPHELEVIDFGFSITLMRKVGLVQSMARDSYEDLRGKHQILSADSVQTLGLGGKAQLPARRWRDGVPDDVNDAGPQTLIASTER
jgi:hypothetical protein